MITLCNAWPLLVPSHFSTMGDLNSSVFWDAYGKPAFTDFWNFFEILEVSFDSVISISGECLLDLFYWIGIAIDIRKEMRYDERSPVKTPEMMMHTLIWWCLLEDIIELHLQLFTDFGAEFYLVLFDSLFFTLSCWITRLYGSRVSLGLLWLCWLPLHNYWYILL